MKVWGHSDALWDASWNPILRAVNTLGVFFGFLCPAGSRLSWKLVAKRSQRGLREPSKMTQNSSQMTPGPHWRTKAYRGVPPWMPTGHPGCIFMHIYAYIHAWSCMFMHIYAYFRIFMHIFESLCIFMAICIDLIMFMHIYAYLYRCTHVYTYLYIFINVFIIKTK